MNTTKWYHSDGQQTFGPLPEEQIIALIQSGQLTGDHFVLQEGSEDWQPPSASPFASHLTQPSPAEPKAQQPRGAAPARRTGAAPVPARTPAARSATQAANQAQCGMNRNLLVLGVVALLVLGGIAAFLASRNGGSITNIFQNTTNQIIHNTYFTQLITSGVTTEKDLEAIGDIRPYGDGFIGVSKEPLAWEQAQALAGRTGARILATGAGAKQELLAWLGKTFSAHLSAPVWIRENGEAGVLSGSEILASKEMDRQRKVMLHWQAVGVALAAATKDQPFVNTLGMQFVPVPITGVPTSGKMVLFSIWETRVQDYDVFVKEKRLNWPRQEFEQGPAHPAVSVSWDDAQAFCSWLTERERKNGKLGVGERYRLPTDHEWSCAIGIGSREGPTTTPGEKSGKLGNESSWGTGWPPLPGTGNLSGEEMRVGVPQSQKVYLITGYSDPFTRTAPVGSFASNSLGIYDLDGNVQEWCEDLLTPTGTGRTIRGSAWNTSNLPETRSSYRFSFAPSSHWINRGFRVVLETSVPSNPAQAAAAIENPLDPQLARATKDAPFVNTLGMKFVPVPDTKVLFSIHETRRQDYAEYAAAVPGVSGWWKNVLFRDIPSGDKDDHPVCLMSWEDSVKFCEWLSKKEDKTYRLPTDAEWSIAVGLGHLEKHGDGITPELLNLKEQTHFPWEGGFPPTTKDKAGNYADESWHEKLPKGPWIEKYNDGYATTAPAMSFEPNKTGLYDMGGNVWEWVGDWWNAAQKEHVYRGASFHDEDRGYLLSSYRHHTTPGYRYYNIGFRVVLEVSAPPQASAAADKSQ